MKTKPLIRSFVFSSYIGIEWVLQRVIVVTFCFSIPMEHVGFRFLCDIEDRWSRDIFMITTLEVIIVRTFVASRTWYYLQTESGSEKWCYLLQPSIQVWLVFCSSVICAICSPSSQLEESLKHNKSLSIKIMYSCKWCRLW